MKTSMVRKRSVQQPKGSLWRILRENPTFHQDLDIPRDLLLWFDVANQSKNGLLLHFRCQEALSQSA